MKRGRITFKDNWLIWIPLIILLIFIFPKSCGNIMPSESAEYTCTGFKIPFLSQIGNQENPQEWCSGICISKTKETIKINNTSKEDNPNEKPLKEMLESFGKIIPILLLIFMAIGVIKWIGSFKKKSSETEIRVYRSP